MKRLQILAVGVVLVGFVLAAWWQHSPFYHEVRTAVTFVSINAPADRVMAVLTDFDKYPEWNPYIVKVERDREFYSARFPKLKIVERADGHDSSHRVEVTQMQQDGFSWTGSLWPAWLLSWTESFTIVPLDATHCRLEVTQSYQGVLLRSYWNYQNHKYLEAVKQMGQALRKRVEQHV